MEIKKVSISDINKEENVVFSCKKMKLAFG